MNLSFSEWSIFKKILSLLILLLIIWLVWNAFFSINQATQEILDLPEGSINLVNNDGEEMTIDIKMGTSATSFASVDEEVIKETVIYHTSPFPASATRVFEGAEVSYEVARFDPEGKLMQIYEVAPDTNKTVEAEDTYQHTLIAYKGFFEENNISVENETTIR